MPMSEQLTSNSVELYINCATLQFKSVYLSVL